ncbi:MAG: hypothetical protein RQ824_00950 [bacterium]|nr:hypothetical protein [bacterium]
MKFSGIVTLVLGIFLFISPPEIAAGDMARKNSEGKVTIRVTYENPGKADPAFSVSMNTHSVNLDGYDMGELSLLRDGKGREYRGKWTSPEGGGHHISGVLLFEGLKPDAGKIELIIRDVAGIKERKFTW